MLKVTLHLRVTFLPSAETVWGSGDILKEGPSAGGMDGWIEKWIMGEYGDRWLSDGWIIV